VSQGLPCPRGSPPILTGTGGDVPGADLAALATAARAVLAGFRHELGGGTLRPPQHASLLSLEAALVPFPDSGEGDGGAVEQRRAAA
jgi:hypothetical protein